MKKFSFLLISFVFIAFFACQKDDTTDPENNDNNNTGSNIENVDFLAYYVPNSDQVLGDQKLIAHISIRDGELSYSSYLNVYPQNSMIENCDVNGNTLVVGLNSADFENRGAYLVLDEESAYYLPLIEPSQSSDYAYYQPTTGDVSDNGYIIFSEATNDISYGDEYNPYLLRFNPSDNTYQVAPDITAFTLAQPEVGSDTEKGIISRTIFASPDGRYAYGYVDAMGTEGGGIHWDYNILYKYDFETQQYTRLGDPNDDDASIISMTSDRRYIIYTNHSDTKVLDLETGNVTFTDMNTINVKKNAWGLNGCCVGTSNSDLYYKDFVNNREYIVCSSSGYGWIYNTIFSANDKYIYFLLEGTEANYLCVTSGIAEGSTYDTIGSVPLEINDMILVK